MIAAFQSVVSRLSCAPQMVRPRKITVARKMLLARIAVVAEQDDASAIGHAGKRVGEYRGVPGAIDHYVGPLIALTQRRQTIFDLHGQELAGAAVTSEPQASFARIEGDDAGDARGMEPADQHLSDRATPNDQDDSDGLAAAARIPIDAILASANQQASCASIASGTAVSAIASTLCSEACGRRPHTRCPTGKPGTSLPTATTRPTHA